MDSYDIKELLLFKCIVLHVCIVLLCLVIFREVETRNLCNGLVNQSSKNVFKILHCGGLYNWFRLLVEE